MWLKTLVRIIFASAQPLSCWNQSPYGLGFFDLWWTPAVARWTPFEDASFSHSSAGANGQLDTGVQRGSKPKLCWLPLQLLRGRCPVCKGRWPCLRHAKCPFASVRKTPHSRELGLADQASRKPVTQNDEAAVRRTATDTIDMSAGAFAFEQL